MRWKSCGPYDRDNPFVYAVGTEDGPIKVGYAIEPQRRASAMRSTLGARAEVLYARRTPAVWAPHIEAQAHRLLAGQHIEGEVFSCSLGEARMCIDRAFQFIEDQGLSGPQIAEAMKLLGKPTKWVALDAKVNVTTINLAVRSGRTPQGLDTMLSIRTALEARGIVFGPNHTAAHDPALAALRYPAYSRCLDWKLRSPRVLIGADARDRRPMLIVPSDGWDEFLAWFADYSAQRSLPRPHVA